MQVKLELEESIESTQFLVDESGKQKFSWPTSIIKCSVIPKLELSLLLTSDNASKVTLNYKFI